MKRKGLRKRKKGVGKLIIFRKMLLPQKNMSFFKQVMLEWQKIQMVDVI